MLLVFVLGEIQNMAEKWGRGSFLSFQVQSLECGPADGSLHLTFLLHSKMTVMVLVFEA